MTKPEPENAAYALAVEIVKLTVPSSEDDAWHALAGVMAWTISSQADSWADAVFMAESFMDQVMGLIMTHTLSKSEGISPHQAAIKVRNQMLADRGVPPVMPVPP